MGNHKIMSRKFNRALQVNTKVLEIIEDPATLAYLGSKLIRRKPRLMPRFVWKMFLFVVLAPSTRKTKMQRNAPDPT
jgi:hypothetical protein